MGGGERGVRGRGEGCWLLAGCQAAPSRGFPLASRKARARRGASASAAAAAAAAGQLGAACHASDTATWRGDGGTSDRNWAGVCTSPPPRASCHRAVRQDPLTICGGVTSFRGGAGRRKKIVAPPPPTWWACVAWQRVRIVDLNIRFTMYFSLGKPLCAGCAVAHSNMRSSTSPSGFHVT